MKKYGEKSLIFEFSISKLYYIELFIKILEKSFFAKFLPARYIDVFFFISITLVSIYMIRFSPKISI